MAEKIIELSVILIVDTNRSGPIDGWPWLDMFALEGVNLYDVSYRVITQEVLEHEGVH